MTSGDVQQQRDGHLPNGRKNGAVAARAGGEKIPHESLENLTKFLHSATQVSMAATLDEEENKPQLAASQIPMLPGRPGGVLNDCNLHAAMPSCLPPSLRLQRSHRLDDTCSSGRRSGQTRWDAPAVKYMRGKAGPPWHGVTQHLCPALVSHPSASKHSCRGTSGSSKPNDRTVEDALADGGVAGEHCSRGSRMTDEPAAATVRALHACAYMRHVSWACSKSRPERQSPADLDCQARRCGTHHMLRLTAGVDGAGVRVIDPQAQQVAPVLDALHSQGEAPTWHTAARKAARRRCLESHRPLSWTGHRTPPPPSYTRACTHTNHLATPATHLVVLVGRPGVQQGVVADQLDLARLELELGLELLSSGLKDGQCLQGPGRARVNLSMYRP